MIGIYVLLTLFSRIQAPDLSGALTAALEAQAEPMVLSASFSELHGIGVGTSVLSNGEAVGKVTSVEAVSLGRGRERRKEGLFNLKLMIRPGYGGGLQEGTVALISAPRIGKKRAAEPVVELLCPRSSATPLRNGTSIRGFESIEKFWIS